MNSILKTASIFVGLAWLSATAFGQGWPQWGQNPQHTGSTPVLGQFPAQKLANLTYDPFVVQEQAENGGELLAHYQAPLINGQDVFMEFISGTYVSCNPPGSYTPFPCGTDNWFNQIWNEKRLHWHGGQLLVDGSQPGQPQAQPPPEPEPEPPPPVAVGDWHTPDWQG